MRAILPLLLAPAALAQADVGDLFVKIPPNVNALCVLRPDGAQVACSQGAPSDWWITGTPTADLGWVTLALGANGYDLLRFDHAGARVGQASLPQVWDASELRTTSDGRIVIADPAIDVLHFVTPDGAYLGAWTLGGSFTPNRICLGPDDDVWAFDGGNGKARHYDPAGSLVGTFDTGLATWDVERTAAGTFWLFQLGSATIWHLDATGAVLGSVDYVHGSIPVALAVGLDGDLWIAEWNSDEVDHIDTTGNLLGSFTTLGPPAHMWVIPPGGPIGTSYCGPGAVNSTGQPGVIAATGRVHAHLDQVRLAATQLPPHQLGMFLASQTQGFVTPPGSQGNLCLGGSIARFRDALTSTGPAGRLELEVDTTAIPTWPPAPVLPGQTWNFQAWHRDVNPGATSNFTDGVSIRFL